MKVLHGARMARYDLLRVACQLALHYQVGLVLRQALAQIDVLY